MDIQQLYETIQQQNQVIIFKDAYIKDLKHDLKQTRDKLSDAKWEISCQKFDKEWASEAIRQKTVHIIDGFEYNTRYVPLELTIILMLASVALTVFILICGK